MRQLNIKLIKDLGNAVVVQVIDRVEVLPKHGRLYNLLKSFMESTKDADADSDARFSARSFDRSRLK